MVDYAFECGTRSSMIQLKLNIDLQGLKVYRVYINVSRFNLDPFHSKVKFGQICLFLCLYQTNSGEHLQDHWFSGFLLLYKIHTILKLLK